MLQSLPNSQFADLNPAVGFHLYFRATLIVLTNALLISHLSGPSATAITNWFSWLNKANSNLTSSSSENRRRLWQTTN